MKERLINMSAYLAAACLATFIIVAETFGQEEKKEAALLDRLKLTAKEQQWEIVLGSHGTYFSMAIADGKKEQLFPDRFWTLVTQLNDNMPLEGMVLASVAAGGGTLAVTVVIQRQPMVAIWRKPQNVVETVGRPLAPKDKYFATQWGVREIYLSPDGSQLAYIIIGDRVPDGKLGGDFCVFDLQTKKLTVVSDDPTLSDEWFIGNPWSADSKKILFPAADNKLGVYDIVSGEKKLYQVEGRRACWSLNSPNTIYTLAVNGDVVRVDAKTSEQAQLCRVQRPNDILQINISPDDAFLFVMRHNKVENFYSLEVLEPLSGDAATVETFRDFTPFFSIRAVSKHDKKHRDKK